MGSRGASSGRRGGTQVFDRLRSDAENKAAVDAIMQAPAGSRIGVSWGGLGTYGTSLYEITLRGMSKKELTPITSDGRRTNHRGVALSRANVKKFTGIGKNADRVEIATPGRNGKTGKLTHDYDNKSHTIRLF